jgi:hypothetical protein
MKQITIGLLVTVLLLVAFPATTARATPLEDVRITVDLTAVPGGHSFGPFVATGPVCPSGIAVDVNGRGLVRPTGGHLQIWKTFRCADGSGWFQLLLQVDLQFDPWHDTFNWTVVEGSGAYVHLHGRGTGYGVPTTDHDGVFDTFVGEMHNP